MAMTMRERIAAAAGGFKGERMWRASPESVREAYLLAADAVLAELETPTDGMIEAGVDALPSHRLDADEVFAIVAAAIRAAKDGK